MHDQIICPNCRQTIPLTEALSHQIREKYRKFVEEDRKKHAAEYEKRLESELAKSAQETEEKLKAKIKREMELKIQDTRNESEELKKRMNELQEQMLETSKLNRQLKSETEQSRLEYEKKLAMEQDKIRAFEQKRLDEEYRLKIAEKEKKLHDALLMNEELKRKLEQGSQQTQGEVLELELETTLKREFPYDEIRPVAKGIRGADVLQVVKNSLGRECGVIMWESKRTKAWSNEWVTKLKEDQRQVKAEVAVIITLTLPPDVKYFGNRDGVWIGNYDSILGLAIALRSNLIDLAGARNASIGKNEKMEILYNYLSGAEFRMRVEGIIEAFTSMQDDVEKEKRWFTAKWAKQEKNIRKVIDNTIGMHGDLQSIMGKSLPEISALDLLPEVGVDGADGIE